MENLILIRVHSLEGLEPNKNIIIIDEITGQVFRGNEAELPIRILDENNPTSFRTQFLLMGA